MSTIRTAFAIVPSWVIERVTNGTALRYYMHIACRYSNEKRHAFPSEETLARDLGDTVRTAQRAIRVLRDADALIITRNRQGNGHLGGNRYWLPLDDPRDHTTNMTGGRDHYDQPEHSVSAGRNQPTKVAADQTTKMSVHEPDPRYEPDTNEPDPKPSATAHADAGGQPLASSKARGATPTARRTSRTAPPEVGTQGPAESIMEGEGATVTDLFGGQPPTGKSRKRGKAPDPDAEARAKNAGDVVAAWVDAYRTTGAEPPGYRCGQVGKEAKALLAAGNSVERLIESAKNAGRQGWWSLERELTAAARVAGYRAAQPNRIRDFKSPVDQSVYDEAW
jgi:hypothetical protein